MTLRGWLCIAPGITTGWALLDERGNILGTSVWGTAELKTSLDAVIRTAHLSGMTLTVVIERIAPGKGLLEQKLAAVVRDIDYVVRETYELDVIDVSPGAWEATPVPAAWQDTPLMSPQRAAIRMGHHTQLQEEYP